VPTVTPVKVVDASALAAVLFGEPEGEAIAARLEASRLAAPALLPFEVASVCLKKMRRHPEIGDKAAATFDMLARMEIDLVGIDLAGALRLADEAGLSVYDASYLWLARELRAELVTLDKRLETVSAAMAGRGTT